MLLSDVANTALQYARFSGMARLGRVVWHG